MSATRIDDGGPAFPTHAHPGSSDGAAMSGMTIRDYFAAKAMQAIIGGALASAIQSTARDSGKTETQIVAGAAYEFANAMIAARRPR